MEMKLIPYTVESLHSQMNQLSYGVDQCQVPAIWETGEKGAGVVVAIIDTGVDMLHQDLKGSIIDGVNFVEDTPDYQDDNGHGTHVAGIVLSVAPEAKLLICKVLDRRGSGSYENIIQGIRHAMEWKGANGERVRVINMSLGGPDDVPELKEVILQAVSKGILICCASGNEGDDREESYEFGFPGYYNEVISVGACDENRKLARFSNTNLEVDTVAAGVNIISTYLNNNYAYLSGTSMATPHIAGIFALLINIGEREFKRVLTESELFGLLVKICCSIGYQKSSEGYGLPQLKRILKDCNE